MTSSYFALLCLSSQYFGGGRTFSEEKAQSVLLQAHVPYGPGGLSRLLPGVDKYQHLKGAGECQEFLILVSYCCESALHQQVVPSNYIYNN